MWRTLVEEFEDSCVSERPRATFLDSPRVLASPSSSKMSRVGGWRRSPVVGLVAWRPLVAIRFVPTMPRWNDRVALTSQGSPRTTQGATGGSRGMFSRIEIRLSRAPGTPETTHTVRRCIEYWIWIRGVDSLPLPLLSFPPYNSTLVPLLAFPTKAFLRRSASMDPEGPTSCKCNQRSYSDRIRRPLRNSLRRKFPRDPSCRLLKNIIIDCFELIRALFRPRKLYKRAE